MFPVSLDCPFLIATSVFSNFYLMGVSFNGGEKPTSSFYGYLSLVWKLPTLTPSCVQVG
jgi:hypothetical protein